MKILRIAKYSKYPTLDFHAWEPWGDRWYQLFITSHATGDPKRSFYVRQYPYRGVIAKRKQVTFTTKVVATNKFEEQVAKAYNETKRLLKQVQLRRRMAD